MNFLLTPVIILRCGDLNVSHQSIDLANPKSNSKTAGFTKEERDDFAKILADGFIDSCMLKLFLNVFNQKNNMLEFYKISICGKRFKQRQNKPTCLISIFRKEI